MVVEVELEEDVELKLVDEVETEVELILELVEEIELEVLDIEVLELVELTEVELWDVEEREVDVEEMLVLELVDELDVLEILLLVEDVDTVVMLILIEVLDVDVLLEVELVDKDVEDVLIEVEEILELVELMDVLDVEVVVPWVKDLKVAIVSCQVVDPKANPKVAVWVPIISTFFFSAPEETVIPTVGSEFSAVKLVYPDPTVKSSVPAPRYTLPVAKTIWLRVVVALVVAVGVLGVTPSPAAFFVTSNG